MVPLGDPGKQARAKELFRQYGRVGRMLLSTQVVQGFYAAGSRERHRRRILEVAVPQPAMLTN